MLGGKGGVPQDLMLRAAGSLPGLIGYAAIHHLSGDRSLLVSRHPSLLDLACATVGFLGLSASALLILCGAHIFDEVEVSQRWVRLRRPSGE